ncbi:MAG: 2-C-methyl-D-erythritol 2,4-cyclodiphosphate synthase, partial [Spirochaetaceae bacterium]|nr:2-C-methyl-D-erythritol 2,4-cyclodiphosphate synthase [Spirochaetaceae bacterium]
GELGHSDGDVLWHAIIDAMLGACALGDIGTHFPPGDPAWKDADSADLARRAAALVKAEGWKISNIDSTVILEKPKLGPYREAICASIGRSLGIATSSVSFKAKTNEGLDAVGRGEAVMARAIVLLTRQQDSTHIVRE